MLKWISCRITLWNSPSVPLRCILIDFLGTVQTNVNSVRPVYDIFSVHALEYADLVLLESLICLRHFDVGVLHNRRRTRLKSDNLRSKCSVGKQIARLLEKSGL